MKNYIVMSLKDDKYKTEYVGKNLTEAKELFNELASKKNFEELYLHERESRRRLNHKAISAKTEAPKATVPKKAKAKK